MTKRSVRFLGAWAVVTALGVMGLPICAVAADGAPAVVEPQLVPVSSAGSVAVQAASDAVQAIQPTVRADAIDFGHLGPVVADRYQGSVDSSGSGLRAPGDNDTLLYDNLQGGTWSGNNQVGDDMGFGAPAPLGFTYYIDEISFQYIPIASTTVETWARVTIWQTYEINLAADPLCTGLPVHSNAIGVAILNLGADENSTCDTYERRQINLTTGEVADLYNSGAVIAMNGVVTTDSVFGPIAGGHGGLQGNPASPSGEQFVTVELGQPNLAGDDIMDGPVDGCGGAPGPGGRVVYSDLNPLVGVSNSFWYDRDGATANGTFDCDEGRQFTSFAQSGANLRLRGSIALDCDDNFVPDDLDIARGAADVDNNGVPDSCQLADCDANGIADTCDINCANSLPNGTPCTDFACGLAIDCNADSTPDACQIAFNDCNSNGTLDSCDIAGATSNDCQPNGIPDECDIDPTDPDGSGTYYRNCDLNAVPDSCERLFLDCNGNGEDDACDILFLVSNDVDGDLIPDECVSFDPYAFIGFESAEGYTIGAVEDQPWPTDPDSNGWVLVGTPGVGDYFNVALTACPTNGPNALEWKDAGSEGAQLSTPIFEVPGGESDQNGLFAVLLSTPAKAELSWSVEFDIEAADSDLIILASNDFVDPNVEWQGVVGIYNWSTNGVDSEWYLSDGANFGAIGDVDGPGCYDITLTVDLTPAASPVPSSSLLDAGEYTISNGTTVLTGRFSPNHGTITSLVIWSNSNGFNAAGTRTAQVDNISYSRWGNQASCALWGSTDCNDDDVCDFFQLNEFDLDGNGILDMCEGFCGDCNNNALLDSVEIAADSSIDSDLNGVIDACEKTTHTNDFEVADGFVLGDIEGQQGFHRVGGSLSEISSTPAGWQQGTPKLVFPRSGAQHLVVKANPTDGRSFSLLYGPRQDAAGDADIEMYTWDWGISAFAMARVMVEIGDLCVDAGTSGLAGDGSGDDFDENIWIDFANAGLQLRGQIPGAVPTSTIRLFALQNETADHSYQAIAGVGAAGSDNVRSLFSADGWHPAGLRIVNSRGEIDILWTSSNADTQSDFQADPFPFVVQTFSQTIGNLGGSLSHIGGGGDRQITIRTEDRPAVAGGDPSYPTFGTAGTTEFYFDDMRYQTSKDCDADGVDDTDFLNGPFGAGYDVNGDGIPDNCQDCDADCGPFPILMAEALTCLDPYRLAGNDCNNNSIPDNCDVGEDEAGNTLSFTLPYVTMVQVSGCLTAPDTFLPNGECYEARRGGGSCDLNTNGTPDTCDGTDCNGNGCLDSAEIDNGGGSLGVGGPLDVDSNGQLDECQGDCNGNGRPDGPIGSPLTDLNIGLGSGGSQDAFPNNLPSGSSDGIPDECCVTCTGSSPNITCEITTPDGDLDRDGDVDAQDYQYVQRCGSLNQGSFPHPQGTVVGSATGGLGFDGVMCGCADFDGSGVIDDADAGIILIYITGPQ